MAASTAKALMNTPALPWLLPPPPPPPLLLLLPTE
jgi:hypothetical protein